VATEVPYIEPIIGEFVGGRYALRVVFTIPQSSSLSCRVFVEELLVKVVANKEIVAPFV
jgi:hypothetical protein